MRETTRIFLQDLLRRYSATADGAWLNDFDWEKIPFDWSPKCNVGNGIMGMYSFGEIRLMDLEFVPDQIFPTLIHELYHRWQWVKHPWHYLLGKLVRPLIEVPADRETAKAEAWLDTLPREVRYVG